MIKLKPYTTNENLIKAIKLTEQMFDINTSLGKAFFDRLKTRENYDMSDAPPVIVEELILNLPHYITVRTYKPWWRWSKAMAMVKNKSTININKYRINRSVASLVGSIAHETIHCIGYDTKYYIGHGNNSPAGKENTYPYAIGRIAKELILRQEWKDESSSQRLF